MSDRVFGRDRTDSTASGESLPMEPIGFLTVLAIADGMILQIFLR